MTEVYLIHLEGQGDIEAKIVDKETFDWITSGDLGRRAEDKDKSGWIDQNVPASQISKLQKQAEGYGHPMEEVYITIGTYGNDRAIACCAAEGYASQYDDDMEALADVAAKGDQVVETFYGCIY